MSCIYTLYVFISVSVLVSTFYSVCVCVPVHIHLYQCMCGDSFPSSSCSRTQHNSQKMVGGKFLIDASEKTH